MSDTTCDLLAGGFDRCGPAWTKPADSIDQCFKVYVPQLGRAAITVGPQTVALRPGEIYFIPGYQLTRQACPRRLDVYWIHFIPKSLYLFFLLSHVSRVHAWPARRYAQHEETWRQFGQNSSGRHLPLFYRIHALLLDLIAEVLAQYDFRHMAEVDPVWAQLRPAVAFMDQHFLKNPSLAQMASAAGLAPNYFHRKFAQTFRLTPYAYILQRRMNVARQLLLGTEVSVQAVARRTGYANPFHFSSAFRRYFGVSPSRMRQGVSV